MIRLTVLISVLFITTAFGQNICPNPGFEQLSGCPSGAGEINLATPWTDAGTPADLFSFCHVNGIPAGCNDVGTPLNFAGNSSAHGGSTYAGFFSKLAAANQRTYIQVPLTAAMSNGQLYQVSAFFKRSSGSEYATNRLGISLSTGPLAQAGGQFIPVTPQAELTTVVADTGSWAELKSYYTGTGLEDQLIIGNFRNDVNTTKFNFSVPAPACSLMAEAAFYYVDDITVIPVTEQLSVTGDTMICTGDSAILTGISNTEGWWSLASTPADTIPDINNSINVNPIVNTTFIWHGYQNSITVTVSISPPPLVSLPADTTVCDGIPVILDATNAGSVYLWSTGDTSAQIMAADSGIYTVVADNGFCQVTDTFQLSVITNPEINFPETGTICSDNEEFLVLQAGPGESYLWQPGGDTTSFVTAQTPGIYTVQVSHSNGCIKSDTIIISEICTETLYVPGAFSPNEDNKNELFYADGTNILSYKIQIFNRWGQPVFMSAKLGISGGWNGKEGQTKAPSGVYSYKISYEALKTNGKIKKETKSGYIILIR